MKKSESTKNIATNLIKFRKVLKQPAKDAKNPFFKSKYVMLEGVVKAIDEALDGVGLTYLQEVTSNGNQVSVSTILLDVSGEYMQFEPLSVPVSKNDAQAFGSAETYARRYTLCSVFGVTSDVDDDGNMASKKAPKEQPRKNRNSQQSAEPIITQDQQKTLSDLFGALAGVAQTDKQTVMTSYLKVLKVSSVNQLTNAKANALIEKVTDKLNSYVDKEKSA